MFGAIVFIIGILDVMVIGFVAYGLINIFKDSALSRIAKVLLIPTACIFYIILLLRLNSEDSSDMSITTGALILLGPIGAALLLVILGYIFGANKKNVSS